MTIEKVFKDKVNEYSLTNTVAIVLSSLEIELDNVVLGYRGFRVFKIAK